MDTTTGGMMRTFEVIVPCTHRYELYFKVQANSADEALRIFNTEDCHHNTGDNFDGGEDEQHYDEAWVNTDADA